MKNFYVYFVDKYGYGGNVTWKAKNSSEVQKKLNQYINQWQLAPISDLIIKEV